MDKIGSEIGQKMRSAVKAKLTELGAGYIDEELPDYVMILLVNKKSKEAMTEALSLFLAEKTEDFVAWLLEVLAKLQQITVPKNAKRKGGESENPKEKKKRISGPEELPALPSITEVIKEGFMQRAKKDLELSASVKKKSDDFDIPTITDMSKEATEKKQESDLAQLQDIQKRIYAAKKQLRAMVSEDEASDVDENDSEPEKTPSEPESGPPKSSKIHINPQFLRQTQAPAQEEPPKNPNKVIRLSTIRRAEREIYVPKSKRAAEAFRRRTPPYREAKSRSPIERRSPVERRSFLARNMLRTPPRLEFTRKKRSSSPRPETDLRAGLSRRMNSRVTVVQKPPSDEEESVDVPPISSVVRIKPRPQVPTSKQANKMLLLRAMADAQKSTTAVKVPGIRARSPRRLQTRPRDLRRNLMVQVPISDDEAEPHLDEEEYVPEPIKRASESETESMYVPKKGEILEAEEDYDPVSQTDTQFVVTLGRGQKDIKKRLGVRTGEESKKEEQSQAPRRPVKERIGFRFHVEEDEETKRRRKERFDRGYERVDSKQGRSPSPAHLKKNKKRERSRESSDDSTSRFSSGAEGATLVNPNVHKLRQLETSEINRSLTPPAVRPDRARTISPINFDLTDEETRSRSSDDESDFESRINKENLRQESDMQKRLKLRKLDSLKKFDNIPSLLSTVTVALDSGKKPRERCRFFPNCRDGESCEYHHPSAPCISFPSCKFGDKCLYLHPKCKFDLSCTRPDCNYMHSVPIVISVKSSGNPLASSVVPVQNYQGLNMTPLPSLCKFYPNCTNSACHFYHPKPCKFGKMCNNKIECNFYHFDLPSKDKLKWSRDEPDILAKI